ncbi:transmembrane protein 154 isoform X1 [Anguilla anguilla]|uniref:transmembrane protein 154 isoform X1 n=1 Tax=Anguilla anguilla TaxID=7936 RepID=UPI0015AB6552|nr:transmembrane protein 154 isoform X1 [Anguilla anguilla]
MATSERGKGQRRHQEMTLLLLLVLTAGLAGRVRGEDHDTTGDEAIEDEDPALNAGDDDVIPTVDTAFTTLHSPGEEGDITPDDNGLSGEGELNPPLITTGRGNPLHSPGDATDTPPEEDENLEASDLDPLMIIIPLVLLLLLVVIASLAAYTISRRRAKKHSDPRHLTEDEILHGCENEKIPMPMFEDDVPSVLELEMEDLEKWMVKDTGRICVDSAGDER